MQRPKKLRNADNDIKFFNETTMACQPLVTATIILEFNNRIILIILRWFGHVEADESRLKYRESTWKVESLEEDGLEERFKIHREYY